MKKLLWISPYVPYDDVPHAGGKTHNYYIKYFQKSGNFDIHLVTLAQQNQKDFIDLEQYGISFQVAFEDGNLLKNTYRKIYNLNSLFNRKHRLCKTILSYQYGQLKKMVKEYAKSDTPDVVIMQWTGAAFLLPLVKEIFPEAYTIIIEEDVAFLGYERIYKNATSKSRLINKDVYEKLKKSELQLLRDCDLVVVNNEKDSVLIQENRIEREKIYVAAPFYEDYSSVSREQIIPKIIFYGVMSRDENHQAAMWVIENIMPRLEDTDITFEIIGSNPREELKRYANDRIRVRGYVKDVRCDFAEALCMVVPLHLGAGIKVKVLEGMSAGVPVLTNSIGIEGIPAVADKEYYYCESVEEYVTIIRRLYESVIERSRVSAATREFMLHAYNINMRLDGLIERILKES